MAAYLGIDLGTSYFKAGVFDSSGRLLGLGRVAAPTSCRPGGFAEQPAESFWIALRAACGAALKQAGTSPSSLAGVSYASQANSFLLLGDNDVPLTPLVSWTDGRAAPLPANLAAFGDSPAFLATAGFSGLTAEFALAKLRWFQEHEPRTWSRARRVQMISDYFVHALTGEAVTDLTTAAFTGALDTRRDAWWPAALQHGGLASSQLSTPRPAGIRAGRTTARATDLLGLPPGLPVGIGSLDHHAAAVGVGVERFGPVSISIGTVLAALRLGDFTPRAGCFLGRHAPGRSFFQLSFQRPGAPEVARYRDQHLPHGELLEMLRWSAQCAPCSPAAPSTEQERQLGAGMLRVVEQLAEAHAGLILRLGGLDAGRPLLVTGGATRSPDWLQILADYLDVEVCTPANPEPACLGAAIFAATAAGEHADVAAAAAAMVQPVVPVRPRPAVAAAYAGRRPRLR